jgi:hypothetical protein
MRMVRQTVRECMNCNMSNIQLHSQTAEAPRPQRKRPMGILRLTLLVHHRKEDTRRLRVIVESDSVRGEMNYSIRAKASFGDCLQAGIEIEFQLGARFKTDGTRW